MESGGCRFDRSHISRPADGDLPCRCAVSSVRHSPATDAEDTRRADRSRRAASDPDRHRVSIRAAAELAGTSHIRSREKCAAHRKTSSSMRTTIMGSRRWCCACPTSTVRVSSAVSCTACSKAPRAQMIGPIDVPYEFVFMPDLGPVVETLTRTPQAFGRVLHLAGAGTITHAAGSRATRVRAV